MLHDTLIACGTYRDLVFFKNEKVFKIVKRAHSGWINGILNVRLPGNSNRILTGGGKTIKLWDLEVFKCLEKIGKHKSSINCLSSCDVTKNDWLFASGHDFPQSQIRVFSYKSLTQKYTIDMNRSVREIKSFNNGKDILVLEGSLNMGGSLVNYKTSSVTSVGYARVKSIEIISKKKFVLGIEGGEFNVMSIKKPQAVLSSSSFAVTVGGLCTHLGKGKFLSFNVHQQSIRFLRPITGLEDGESEFPLNFAQGYDDMILLKYYPDDEVVITSTKDNILRIWKLTNNRSKISLNNLKFKKTQSFVKSVALVSAENELKITQPRIEFISNLLNMEEEEEEESEGEGGKSSSLQGFCRINKHVFFPIYLLFDSLENFSKLQLNKIRNIVFDEEEEEISNEPEFLFLRVIFGVQPKRIGLRSITKLIRIFFHLEQVNYIRSCLRYIYDHRFKEFEEFYVIDDDKDESERTQFFRNVVKFFKTNFSEDEGELYRILDSSSQESSLPTFSQVYRSRLKGIYPRCRRQVSRGEEEEEEEEFDHNLVLEIREDQSDPIISRFYVHKEVLIFGSSFFYQLFSFQSRSTSDDDDDDDESRKKVEFVKIELLKEKEVKKIVEFCYLGRFEEEEEKEGDAIVRSMIGILVHAEMYMDVYLKTYTLTQLKVTIEKEWKNDNHEVIKRRIKELAGLMSQQLPRSMQLEIIHFWMEKFGISKKQMDILLGKVVVKRKKLKKRGEEEEEEEEEEDKCFFCV